MSISPSLTMPSSSQPAHLPRTARHSVAAVAAVLVGLAAAPQPAAAQAVAQGATRQSGAMICDPVAAPAPAAAPVAARPASRHVAPKAVAAGSHTVKKPAVVAAAPRKSAPRAAGHRTVAAPVAKAAPAPQCRKAPEPALAAAAPTPVGVSNLVNSLPWTAPATVAVLPTATAPVWDEVAAPADSSSSRSLLRPAAIGAGLLGGAVALLASNHGSDRSIPPIGNGTQPPVITPGTPGSPDIPGGPVTTVPEPGTMVLVGTGIAALVARKRRRRGE